MAPGGILLPQGSLPLLDPSGCGRGRGLGGGGGTGATCVLGEVGVGDGVGLGVGDGVGAGVGRGVVVDSGAAGGVSLQAVSATSALATVRPARNMERLGIDVSNSTRETGITSMIPSQSACSTRCRRNSGGCVIVAPPGR